MGPDEINFILKTFNMTSAVLAHSLGVAPFTVARWLSGASTPTGLQEEVLRALHQAAQKSAAENEQKRRFAGGLIALGVGALIFAALTQENAPKLRKKRRRN